MRYYSTILIDFKNGVIAIHDLAIPCTKKEALKWAKQKSIQENAFILCTIETKEIIDRRALEKFNLKILKGGVF